MTEEDKNQDRVREDSARSMSEEEVRDYHGLTLNEDGRQEQNGKEERENIHFVHIEKVSIRKFPFWKKALFTACLIVALASFFAVAWVLFLAAGIIFIGYWLLRFLRRYL